MLFSWTIPPSSSPTESKRLFYKSVSFFFCSAYRVIRFKQAFLHCWGNTLQSSYIYWKVLHFDCWNIHCIQGELRGLLHLLPLGCSRSFLTCMSSLFSYRCGEGGSLQISQFFSGILKLSPIYSNMGNYQGLGSLCGSYSKESACSARDLGSIPESGRSPGEGNGNPLQYSCLRNPMDRRAWRATVHGVTKSWTILSE